MAETREARPTTGTLTSKAGFGISAFGFGKFGEDTKQYENTKEARLTTSKTNEALNTTTASLEARTAA